MADADRAAPPRLTPDPSTAPNTDPGPNPGTGPAALHRRHQVFEVIGARLPGVHPDAGLREAAGVDRGKDLWREIG